jgi:hypothetical protein
LLCGKRSEIVILICSFRLCLLVCCCVGCFTDSVLVFLCGEEHEGAQMEHIGFLIWWCAL